MSDSLDERLRKTSEEVRDFEQQFDKFNRDNALRLTMGTLPPARIAEGQELQSRLYEARQRQTSLLLESISASSNRLEVATINLQKITESQVKVALSQVKATESLVAVSDTQARTMKDLLKSSHLLEQFTVYLMVLTGLSIFLVEYTQGLFKGSLGIVGAVGLVGAILAMFILGGYLPRLRKLDKSEP